MVNTSDTYREEQSSKQIRFIDLFCGIGGFRFALESVAKRFGVTAECVFSSDIDRDCQVAYEANFGHRPEGDISAYPYSCALRAGASYNYLLVNGERRLTPREMLRLQGFPETFQIACSESQTRKQAGNSLPVNVAAAVLTEVFRTLQLGIAVPPRAGYETESPRFFESPAIFN